MVIVMEKFSLEKGKTAKVLLVLARLDFRLAGERVFPTLPFVSNSNFLVSISKHHVSSLYLSLNSG